MGAERRGANDLGITRELLLAAHGYTVFGREGQRVGAFIELVGTGRKQIAIRHDGTFLWRRRVLPITTVESVFPERRAIVLNVDRRSLASQESTDVVVEPHLPAGESAASSDDVQSRIARYLSAGDRAEQANRNDAGATRTAWLGSAAPEPRPPGPTCEPSSQHVDRTRNSFPRHLRFVSTSHGYTLVELEGPPPALGADIEVPEQPGSFLVTKLGPSPLPNDPRICAYLERTAGDPPLAEPAQRA